MKHMDIRQTCCSKDNRELVFPSFSAVFIHTFMLSEGEIKPGVGDVSGVKQAFKDMQAKLRQDPNKDDLPISSLAECI